MNLIKTAMKYLFILFATLLLNISPASAQSDKEDVEILQATYGKEKKELVRQYLKAPKDSVAFWKEYDEYEIKRKAIGRERLELLRQYVESYETMTGPVASKIVTKTIENDKKYSELYHQYYSRFSKIIGSVEAARLFQLEYYLQTMIRETIQENLPGIKELDKNE
ncbi:hypothetical protein GZH53_14980 [Flavihumibacter sp. R14]|nr:hypothetical protein [Flavihumibacter soli]